MRYEDYITLIDEINAKVEGIRKTYTFEPTKSVIVPCLYTKLLSGAFDTVSSAELAHWDIAIILLLSYTEDERCELQVAKFVDRVRETYQQKVQLGGELSGQAQIMSVTASYIPFGKAIYRYVEFRLRIEDINPVDFKS